MAQFVVICDKFGNFSSDSFQAMPLMEGNVVRLPPAPRGFPAEVSQQESAIKPATQQDTRNEARGTVAAGAG